MGFRVSALVREIDPEQRPRTAFVCGRVERSYDELDQRSSRVAQALLAAGVEPGERVLVLDRNSIEFFEVLFGAVKAGAVAAPVNLRLTPAEVGVIVADSGARLMVAGSGPLAALATAATAGTDVRIVETGEEYEAWLAAAPAEDPQAPEDDDTVVLQLYTSGTTGVPKGVMLSNRNFDALAKAADLMAYGPEAVTLLAMPFFHIGGAGPGLLGLYSGARNVIVPEFEPVAVLDTLERERVTTAFLVPAALAMLAAVPGAADRDWSALQSLAYGASPITATSLKTILATFRAPMMQVYGMTETTGSIVQLPPEDHDPGGPREHLLRSAGKPYDWVELKIVDPATGGQLPVGEVGELLVRTAAVTPGYWHKPEETKAALDGGWLHTGDAGYLDDEGYLFLTDRIKDMIVTGAENVYPIEVENVLSEHPDVADVAVIGVPDERWGETVKAVVVPRAGAELDPDELLAWSKERLAGFKRPRSIDVVDALPRNPSGKILKKELRAPYWDGAGRSIG
jgi:acyl-CoA synthetase (AMP-forming)/AMP-acid ligase II